MVVNFIFDAQQLACSARGPEDTQQEEPTVVSQQLEVPDEQLQLSATPATTGDTTIAMVRNAMPNCRKMCLIPINTTLEHELFDTSILEGYGEVVNKSVRTITKHA